MDKDRKYFTVCLKTALTSGLRGIQGFKKEMGFGEKVVKLKTGAKKDIRKYTCNWAYFYICLLDINLKISIAVIVAHLFPLVFLHPLKPLPIFFNFFPSEFSG